MAQATEYDTSPGQLNGLMLAAAVVSSISGLLYGYDTGIISGALLQISEEFHTGDNLEQAIAAGILLGAVIGALNCSLLSEKWGRHRTILLICSVLIVGSLLCSVAPGAIALALARVLLGFAVGGATQTVPMYVAELEEIVELEERKQETKASHRGWSGLRKQWVRPALIVGGGIAAFTQLSGIEMIIYYAPTILTDNGFSTSASPTS